MTAANIERVVAELLAHYRGAQTAREGELTLIRLPAVELPEGCTPRTMQALVVLHPGEPKPRFYIDRIPSFSNGVVPRSMNATPVAGESWYGYSFNIQWDDNRHTGVQFVEGQLRRFAKHE
jgi:hypothetical protein